MGLRVEFRVSPEALPKRKRGRPLKVKFAEDPD